VGIKYETVKKSANVLVSRAGHMKVQANHRLVLQASGGTLYELGILQQLPRINQWRDLKLGCRVGHQAETHSAGKLSTTMPTWNISTGWYDTNDCHSTNGETWLRFKTRHPLDVASQT
jgi:hypothetical protein